MRNWETLSKEIYSLLEEGKRLVAVFAPTGFGKTMSSPFLLSLLKDAGLASRLVHVVPTRALLRQIYTEKFASACRELGLRVAYQSADRIPSGVKSPYFLADLVVTTLESFLLNAYKFPPSEVAKVLEKTSEGHYYPSIAAIASSVVFMDEAHMYLGDPEGEGPGALVASALSALSRMNVPVVVGSATMSVRMLKSLVEQAKLKGDALGAVYVCSDKSACPQVGLLRREGFEVRLLPASSSPYPAWTTRSLESLAKAIWTAGELCRDRLVLFTTNTVGRAISIYGSLRDRCDSALIHSLMSERDKESVLDARLGRLREARRGLIVASPVADVGVDIDADALVTEPAPIENLAQRVGRLCRGSRRCDMAEVFVVDDASLRGPFNEGLTKLTLSELRKGGGMIEWRSLWSSDSGRTYVEIIESAASTYPHLYSVTSFTVLESVIERDTRPLDLIDSLAERFRGLSLVKLSIGWPREAGELERGDYVLLDVSTLRRLNAVCLERESGRGRSALSLAVIVKTENNMVVRRCESQALADALRQGSVSASHARHLRSELRGCLEEGEHSIDYFLVAKSECYETGVGLRVA